MPKTFLVVPAVLATTFIPSISEGAPVKDMCLGQVATIVGTPGDDYLTGTAKRDVIVGLGGNDRIDGLGGDDLICGNANAYWRTSGLTGAKTHRRKSCMAGPVTTGSPAVGASSTSTAGEGKDLIRGGRGSEQVDDDARVGNAQGGRLAGGPGDDVIRGGPGDDDLYGGWRTGLVGDGGDHLYGGTGNDFLADEAYSPYCERGCQSSDDANDSLFGGLGSDALLTSGGDDYQYGGYGNDALGVSGYECCDSDVRVKDLGDDTYDGGPGRDVFHAGRASTTSVFIDLSAGRASSISLGEDTVLNLETAFGSPYDDTLIGDDGDNWLIGGGYPYTLGRPMGNDHLVGRGGDDVLEGLDGAVGSEYDDSVDAGEGNDFCTVDSDDELISCETHGAQYPPY